MTRWTTLVFTLFLFAGMVAAQEFAGLLRDEMALALRASAASAGMGNAYVAVPGADSMNPAALGVIEDWQAEVEYVHTRFDDAPHVNDGIAKLYIPVPRIGGCLRLMGEYYDSGHRERTKLGLDADFDSRTLGFQYGRAFLDGKLRVGLGGYPYEKANIDFFTPGGAHAIHGEAFSQVGSLDGGIQYDVHPRVTLGFRAIYIIDRLEGTLYPPATGGLKHDLGHDNFHIHYLVPGIAIRPFDHTLLAVDYWRGKIDGKAASGGDFEQDIDRWSFGVEQRLLDDRLILRTGGWNGGFTAGAGTRLMDGRLSLDYAYVNESYQDIGNVFGDGQSHFVTLRFKF